MEELEKDFRILIDAWMSVDQAHDGVEVLAKSLSKHVETKLKSMVSSSHVSVTSDGYTISEHPDLAGRKVVWIESPEGDGTTVELKNIFQWAM